MPLSSVIALHVGLVSFSISKGITILAPVLVEMTAWEMRGVVAGGCVLAGPRPWYCQHDGAQASCLEASQESVCEDKWICP